MLAVLVWAVCVAVWVACFAGALGLASIYEVISTRSTYRTQVTLWPTRRGDGRQVLSSVTRVASLTRTDVHAVSASLTLHVPSTRRNRLNPTFAVRMRLVPLRGCGGSRMALARLGGRRWRGSHDVVTVQLIPYCTLKSTKEAHALNCKAGHAIDDDNDGMLVIHANISVDTGGDKAMQVERAVAEVKVVRVFAVWRALRNSGVRRLSVIACALWVVAMLWMCGFGFVSFLVVQYGRQVVTELCEVLNQLATGESQRNRASTT